MSDAIFLGQKAASMELDDALAVSRVNIDVDSENYYTAGTDTGTIVNVSCPWATATMVQSVLAAMSAYTYRPYTATDALLDPAAELGDAVTVGGVYSVIASLDIDYNRASVAEISAPGLDEIDDEYPYITQDRKETNKVLATTRSLISKSSSEILLSVESQIDDLSASIDIQLDSITSTIQGLDGAISEIDQKVDNIRISVSNGSTSSTITLTVDGVTVSSQNITMSGLVTYTGLSSGTTTINGACIKTGTIDADRLNLTGAILFSDLSTSVQNDINDAYSMASQAQTDVADIDDVVSGWTYGSTTYIDGTRIMSGTVSASTIQGGTIELLDSSERTAGEISLSGSSSSSYAVDIYSQRALRLSAGSGDVYIEDGGGNHVWLDASQGVTYFGGDIVPNGNDKYMCGTSPNRWSDVWCQTGVFNGSDENIKNSIEELPEKYVTFIDNVTPRRFKYDDGTSGRYHAGFTAQNVKEAMDIAGITDLEFAGWAKDLDTEGNDTYALRYTEFLAPMLAKIKQLEARIKELEVA